MFLSVQNLDALTWQAFERAVCRLLLHENFDNFRLVGQTADKGADILAHRGGKRWLFQVKHWKAKVGADVLDQTTAALRAYRAQVPVIVARSGFREEMREHQRVLQSEGIPLQLWDRPTLLDHIGRLSETYPADVFKYEIRAYQEDAIREIVRAFTVNQSRRALIVMATGLGKTFVAAEAVKRISALQPVKVLAVAHSNALVYQLERAFWPFLKPSQETLVWNQYERPTEQAMSRSALTFACLNSIFESVESGKELPKFDIVLIDECHHAGAKMYDRVFGATGVRPHQGPFLIGLTATPWRPDEKDLKEYFGPALITVDLVTGLKKGFLANVDYRVYTDNIDWRRLTTLKGVKFSPRSINRTLFIEEWDDAVTYELQSVWKEQPHPRAIVFCGTIDHAIRMRDRISALGFCSAEAIYSHPGTLAAYERNRILCDFHDGAIDVVCAVDIFNEGVDVPDVNIIVFQRVTHSRRIFIQQLGRGLRLAPDKQKVIVLDFVSDIRRFAAALELKDSLETEDSLPDRQPMRIRLPHKVTFRRVGGEDPKAESFLRQWLEDVAAIEGAGEDTSVLRFPPPLPGGKV